MSSAPTLPAKPRKKRPIGWIIVAIVVIVAIIVAIVVFATRGNNSSTATSDAPKTVTIGVTDKSEPYWTTYTKLAKSKLNVTVKLTNFSDYSLPNPALKDGQLDINVFQHIQYLANYNVTSHDTLRPIGATAVYPLPLFSIKYDKVSALPSGAKIAIPNDAINEARALLVLQSAKLLTLKDGGSAFSTTSDIETRKVDVQTLDAAQTANALQQGSVAGAVVNNNYSTAAGLTNQQRIFRDNPKSTAAAPYVNVFVVTNAHKNNKTDLELAKLFHNSSVQKAYKKSYTDAVVRDQSASALQKELEKVEQDAKAAE